MQVKFLLFLSVVFFGFLVTIYHGYYIMFPKSQLQTELLMTSQIRSHIEYFNTKW